MVSYHPSRDSISSEIPPKLHFDIVILGAGIAGLSLAWKLSKHGMRVLILEKDSEVGGLAKTTKFKDYFVDYCAHRFHTKNTEVLKSVLSLKTIKMYRKHKRCRVFLFGKYLNYPFDIPDILGILPLSQCLYTAVDFIFNYFRQLIRPQPIRSYRDWFVTKYGKKLYHILFQTYSQKIWKQDPAALSADWADERFNGPNLSKFLTKSIVKLLTLDFSEYKLEDEELAPDGGDFYYPEYGIGQLPTAFAKEAVENGTIIHTGIELISVSKKSQRIKYSDHYGAHSISYDILVSTIPPYSLYELLIEKDESIKTLFAANKYMDIIFVYVGLNRERISSDHWIYFPDHNVIFNRAVEFRNWSEKMVPPGKTCICLDITCYYGDDTWSMSDSALISRCIADAEIVQYFSGNEVSDTWVKRVRYAYPVYDLNYKNRLQKIVTYLETDNVYLLGRTGIFRYNNSDNSIEMAFQLADNILSNGEDKSVFEYKIKERSL